MRLLTGFLIPAFFGVTLPISGVQAAETVQVASFGPNPGNLRMFEYVPDGLPPSSPLVVALHGCTQRATDFDDESGWTNMADRFQFALLLPEQQEANNSARCFNFFMEQDNRRGQGEAASIAAMIEAITVEHDLDAGRVFVTGLSAGGAMTAVMLAAYPDMFNAGAIIAGVPYGCASTAGSAFLQAQRSWFLLWYPQGEALWAAYRCGIDRTPLPPPPPARRSPEQWRALLAEAGGPTATTVWPRVSIWHGSADGTVHPWNLDELVKQWTTAHGVDQVPDAEGLSSAPYRKRAYQDAEGHTAVEAVEVPGLGHAMPIDPDGGGPLWGYRHRCWCVRGFSHCGILGA